MIKRISFGTVAPSPAARRVVLCVVLADLTPDPPHERLMIEWFDEAPQPNGVACVLADEHIARGADWLEQRWRFGGARLKHMALAARAPGLTPDAFSQRWRDRAGRVGATPIPEVAKGQAYVQNHPLPGEWAYDAVNEVYFDDLADLRARIDFFDEVGTGSEDDLVREACFVSVREELL